MLPARFESCRVKGISPMKEFVDQKRLANPSTSINRHKLGLLRIKSPLQIFNFRKSADHVFSPYPRQIIP